MQVIFEITSADKFNTDEMESQTLEFAQKYKAENVNHSSSIQINYDNRFHHLYFKSIRANHLLHVYISGIIRNTDLGCSAS